MTAACVVCGDSVELYHQSDHLRFKHPSPHGFKFYLDARPYVTDKPSMLVADIIKLTGASPMYAFEDERGYSYSHAEAVNLTQEPWFFSIPPATYFK